MCWGGWSFYSFCYIFLLFLPHASTSSLLRTFLHRQLGAPCAVALHDLCKLAREEKEDRLLNRISNRISVSRTNCGILFFVFTIFVSNVLIGVGFGAIVGQNTFVKCKINRSALNIF